MNNKIKTDTSYFYDGVKIADMGAAEITSWLNSFDDTVTVHNVENNKRYQEKDIDLVWLYFRDDRYEGDNIGTSTLEVKADTYDSPNFFLEIISNDNKNTPGCFLQTQSDYLYYYFINKKILYIIPTKEAQDWYYSKIEQGKQFKHASVPTKNKFGEVLYRNKGALVNIKQMMKEVNISEYDLNYFFAAEQSA